ncbi:hypothetical protein CDAR_243331 [Caerostris darwini]|uniref:Uncharacterized protein n=1 Tax=Caerostris darwini TaxID=1538125 RepID=A0AAV4MR71_9ARAC|nr:hypothetical protein CDAR_243331 [Caerostris darwini]
MGSSDCSRQSGSYWLPLTHERAFIRITTDLIERTRIFAMAAVVVSQENQQTELIRSPLIRSAICMGILGLLIYNLQFSVLNLLSNSLLSK